MNLGSERAFQIVADYMKIIEGVLHNPHTSDLKTKVNQFMAYFKK